jgi:hypothetical protein
MRPDVVGRLQPHAGPDPAALVVRSDRGGRHYRRLQVMLMANASGLPIAAPIKYPVELLTDEGVSWHPGILAGG